MVRLLHPDRPRGRIYTSRREQWRLLLLIVPLGLVIIAIGQLRDPHVAKRVDVAFAQVAGGASPPSQSSAPPSKLFQGVDADWLTTIVDNSYFRKSETTAWLGMLGALKHASDEELKTAPAAEASYVQLVAQPNAYRGKLVTVYGYVRQVTEQKPAKNDLGIETYYRLVLQPTDGSSWPIFIYCLELPAGLSTREPADGYLKATGVFFKNLSYSWSGGMGTAPIVLAKNIEYFGAVPCGPTMQDIHVDGWAKLEEIDNPALDEALGHAPDASLGSAVLRNLDFDEELLKEVSGRGPLRAEDHEAFYGLLKAVGQIGPHQLARFAQQNLAAVREEWQRRLKAASDASQRALAQESLRSAAQGRYSVAPLFNDAANQQGRLFVFDGIARRAVRVEVGATQDDKENPTAARFGFDHYYEMEVFTDDSQNHPLVFCVRELPPGFPTGDSLREPVRVAGFFFKAWLYRARGSDSDTEPANHNRLSGPIDPARYAPLLIGRAPVRLPAEERGQAFSSYVGVGLFLAGLVGICVAAVVYGRGDRQFRRRTQAVDFSLPEGQSLNDLNLDVVASLPEDPAESNGLL